ncbi:MAG: hypothetical protein NC253_02620, partial [Ruminococcus sp.]|nr:hypothetical protein [Ruminococcus sp.]
RPLYSISPRPLPLVVPFVQCERVTVRERGLKIQKQTNRNRKNREHHTNSEKNPKAATTTP